MLKKFLFILCSFFTLTGSLFLVSCDSNNSIISYDVEFIVDEDIYHTGSIVDGVLSNIPKDPTKDGYVFDGWYLDKDTWENPLTIQALLETPISANNSFSVYAKFIKYSCELDNLSHDYIIIEDVPSTCLTAGHKFEKCKNCGDEQITNYQTLFHSHTSIIIKPATCRESGIVTEKCTREGCDYSYNRTIYALGHSMDYKITKPATCDVSGETTYSCTRENCNFSYILPITALQHTYLKNEITTQPTCTENGVRTFTCTRKDCNHSYTEPIDKLNHTYNSEETIKPCTRAGLKTFTCTRANCNDSYTEIMQPLGYHDCNVYGNCIRCNAQNVCSKNFVAEENTITGYNGNDIDIIIPSMFNGFTINIIEYAFSNNQTIQSVYIPDTVEQITFLAFYSCSNLETIRMSSSIKLIESNSFGGTKIKSIYLPKSIQKIQRYAFANCNSLSTVYYEGSEEEWYNIDIEGNNNNLFINVTYNYVREE